MPRTYVAIDVETPGLDPTQDEIIEVAALRFTLDGPGEHFATLVKARKPIPMQIELLTGIRQHELATAPPFAAIAGDLLAFIGDAAIVAQNAPFDIGFLAAAGLHFTNPVLDTLELARILAPQLTERNLTALALHFGVDYGKAHRALADATATAEVFRGLRRVAVALDPRMVYTLTNLGGAAPWKLNTFFQEVFNELVESGLAVPAAPPPALPKPSISVVDIAREGRPKDAAPAAADLDVDLLAHLLGPEGPVAAAFAGYEHRPEQVGLMRSIAEAFNVGEHLLAEAGTGTGKSMAYLLPALVHALQSNQPVVVSTATIALQEQIVTKDIPLLLRALSTVGGTALSGNLPDFSQARYTHLKGRSNYLCQRRWQGLASSGNLDAAFMARLTVWLGATQPGDRAELQLNSFESGQWARVAATSENCPASQCMTLRNGECFLQKARQRAAQSHLIVVNHALLVSDIASGGNVLPGYNYLIIDEAHHLEDVATDQLGYQANYDTFASFLDRLSQDGGGRANGFLPSLQVSLRTAGTLAALHQGLLDAAGAGGAGGGPARPPAGGHPVWPAVRLPEHPGRRFRRVRPAPAPDPCGAPCRRVGRDRQGVGGCPAVPAGRAPAAGPHSRHAGGPGRVRHGQLRRAAGRGCRPLLHRRGAGAQRQRHRGPRRQRVGELAVGQRPLARPGHHVRRPHRGGPGAATGPVLPQDLGGDDQRDAAHQR